MSEIDILPPTESDDLIPGGEDLKGDLGYVLFCDGTTPSSRSPFCDDSSDEIEGLEVEEDIGLSVGDEEYVEVFQGSVEESHAGSFEDGVLGRGVD